MRKRSSHPTPRLFKYDALQRRLWIAGQRCHHGATGSLLALLSCAGLLAGQAKPAPAPPKSLVALALAGGALMAHDWKDHSVWFSRGSDQPG